jgi:hypothetical protein
VWVDRGNDGNTRPSNEFQALPEFLWCSLASQKKKTPAPNGARVYRRMGEGLGAGGHTTRRRAVNARSPYRFLTIRNFFVEPQKLFSGPGARAGASAARSRPFRQIDRQVHVPAIGKLQITHMDAQATIATAAPFNDVARADGEPVGQTTYLGTHDHLRGEEAPSPGD